MTQPNRAIALSDQEHDQLLSIDRSRSLPRSLVLRARIILLSADGLSNSEIATRCGISKPTVSFWRGRFRDQGLAGLHDELRSGCPRAHDGEAVAQRIHKVRDIVGLYLNPP